VDVRRRQRKSGRSSMALRATTAAALMVRSIAAFPLRFSSSLSLADARDPLVLFRLTLPVLVSQPICRGRSYLSWASGLFDRRRGAAAVVVTAAAAPALTRKSGGERVPAPPYRPRYVQPTMQGRKEREEEDKVGEGRAAQPSGWHGGKPGPTFP
jgi:hypothetical protein